MSIGAQVAKAREERGWNQKELAQRAGLAQSEISYIERGERPNPGIASLVALEKALGLEHGTLSRQIRTDANRRGRKVS
mgnify:FL=1